MNIIVKRLNLSGSTAHLDIISSLGQVIYTQIYEPAVIDRSLIGEIILDKINTHSMAFLDMIKMEKRVRGESASKDV